MSPRAAWFLASACLLGGIACDPAALPTPAPAHFVPFFPDDFLSSFTELRDCRHSHEHELRHIRVFVSPDAVEPYTRLSTSTPYSRGAVLVKLEYELSRCRDEDFSGYTAIKKVSPGTAPAAHDWVWQRVSPSRDVLEQGSLDRCIDCHRVHCAPPYGYDLTCAPEI